MAFDSENNRSGPYACNGSTVDFNVTFYFTDDDHLQVVLTDVDGNETTLTKTTDYSVTGAGSNPPSGKITTVATYASGNKITIIPDLPFTQESIYPETGRFPAKTNEADHDLAAQRDLQLLEKANRTIALKISAPGVAPTFSDFTGSDGLVPIYNEAENSFDPGPDATDIAAAGANATAAAASAVSATASAAAAAASANGMKYRQVRAASTANIASLSGTTTVDGVSLIANDRILLKNQTSPAQNGVYSIAAGAWTRATDMDTWVEVPGTVVVVTEGTINGDKVFLCTSNDGGTLNTTAITFIDWAAVIFDATITNAKLANMAANTIKSTVAGGVPLDLSISTILDGYFGTTRGQLAMRSVSGWITLGPGASGTFLKSNGAGADLSYAAISTAVVSVKIQVFPASATYTPSAGMLFCMTEIVAAGASGGMCSTGSTSGGGGGAGGYGRSILSAATVGASQSVTIGTGGTAPSANASGNSGGNSSFGAIITATGGSGGQGGAGALRTGGAGGSCSGADFNVDGGDGSDGGAVSGQGGASYFGGGGKGGIAVNATAGKAFGSGSGGCNNAVTGAAGKNGYCVVIEFCSQ